MMDCKEVQRFLPAYIDGEFEGQERVSMAAHLEICDNCKRVARFEEAFNLKLRESKEEVTAPPWLENKVLLALDEVEQPARRSIIMGWARFVVPAAVGLLIGGVLVTRQSDPPSPTHMAEQSVNWHRQKLPMDVAGSNPDEVQAFFRDKVKFAVRPLQFNQPKVKLVGGRLSNLRQHQAAYLIYQVNGRRVSVFVFDPSALPDGQVVTQRSPQVRWHKLRGYNVAMFVNNGTGYAVASDMEPKQMIRLISTSY